MNMLWRLLWLILTCKEDPNVSLFAPSRVYYHALPTDVDVLWHINNGRYLSFLDFGRYNAIIKSGLYKKLRRNHCYPVVAAQMIRFKRSITLWQKFTITTQLVYWDDKYVYIKHEFLRQQELCAFAIIKLRFLQKGKGVVSPDFILNMAEITPPAIHNPNYIGPMNECEQLLLKAIKEE